MLLVYTFENLGNFKVFEPTETIPNDWLKEHVRMQVREGLIGYLEH